MSLTETYLLLAIPWLIAGWIRIPRYARYFQQEGYEFKRYSLWLLRNQTEKRYFNVFVSILGLLLGILFCGSAYLIALNNQLSQSIAYAVLLAIAFYPLIGAIIYIVISAVALKFAP